MCELRQGTTDGGQADPTYQSRSIKWKAQQLQPTHQVVRGSFARPGRRDHRNPPLSPNRVKTTQSGFFTDDHLPPCLLRIPDGATRPFGVLPVNGFPRRRHPPIFENATGGFGGTYGGACGVSVGFLANKFAHLGILIGRKKSSAQQRARSLNAIVAKSSCDYELVTEYVPGPLPGA